MPAGRPLELTKRITVPTGDGGSTKITVADAIIREVEATGLPATRCHHAGRVTRESVSKWLSAAARHAKREEHGGTLTDNEIILVRFLYDVETAKARWRSQRLRTHSEMASGGLTTAKVVETVDPTDRDAAGNPRVISRKVETQRLPPDTRAIEWELERLDREQFTPRQEITGPDGGPIEVESREEQEARLVRELEIFQAGIEEAERAAASE